MQNAFPLRKTAIFMDIAPIAHKSLISFTKIDKWSILVKEMGGTIILWGSQWGSQSGSHAQHIAPRPAGQYPDISLAPNNPGIAHPKIIIQSQDNYLLGKKKTIENKQTRWSQEGQHAGSWGILKEIFERRDPKTKASAPASVPASAPRSPPRKPSGPIELVYSATDKFLL